MSLGENVKRLRELNNLTQQQLAELVGVKQPHITRIENNTRGANTELLKKIAKALNVTVNELLYEKKFIGNNLKLLRGKLSFTEYAESLEKKGGVFVDPELLERYEKGKEQPLEKVVKYFAETEGIPIEWFYEINSEISLQIAQKRKNRNMEHIEPEIREWIMDPTNYEFIKFMYNSYKQFKKEP